MQALLWKTIKGLVVLSSAKSPSGKSLKSKTPILLNYNHIIIVAIAIYYNIMHLSSLLQVQSCCSFLLFSFAFFKGCAVNRYRGYIRSLLSSAVSSERLQCS